VVVLDATPFYAQAGGQVGDVGVLESDTMRAAVTDTTRTRGGLILHHVTVETGTLEAGDHVRAIADAERRRAIRANHTATHLVHAALREVLGPHVRQAGSLVAPDRLRFDFTHFAPLTDAEQERIEQLVNTEVVRDIPVVSDVIPLDEALETGAMALFGEKYPDPVRVVSIDGFSRELCGGTHLSRTGEIGSLKITSSESVAAGTRRLEAITGLASFERFQRVEQLVGESSRRLGVDPDGLPDRIAALQASLREAERETAQLRLQLLSGTADGGAEVTSIAEGVQVTARRVADLKSGERRDLAENLLRKSSGDGVVVLAWADEGKAGVLVRVADGLTERLDAREVANDLAAIIGGRGGGPPRLAEAGGREPGRVDELLQQAPGAIEKRLTAA
jgi:alanyl-tRNA synthetase